MMRKTTVLIFFVIIGVILPYNVYAQATQEQDPYKDENFLRVSDATKWDLSKIPWGNPIVYSNPSLYNRKDIYSSASAYTYREFYNNMPKEKYSQLDYKKIIDYSLISNHDKIDANKYLKDLGCRSCSFAKEGPEKGVLEKTVTIPAKIVDIKVKYSEKGITHQNGNFVSIPGDYPAGSLFIAKEDRIEVKIPKGVSSIDMPNKDYVTIDTQNQDLSLPNGVKFNGKLSYKDGHAYIQAGDTAIINGVQISELIVEKEFKKDIYIFFDGIKHEKETKNYVSIDSNKKRLFANAQAQAFMDLNFEKDNPFLKIENGDRAKLGLRSSVEISVQNRDSMGLVPAVEIREMQPYSSFDIWSGAINLVSEIHTEKGIEKLYTGVYSAPFSSSPMSITVMDKNGKNLLGTAQEQKKILMSNYNEVATVPLSSEEGIAKTLESSDYLPLKASERLYYNYDYFTVDNFKNEFPNIEISGKLDNNAIRQITNSLNSLPPEVKNSIKGIVVYDNEEYAKISPKKSSAWTSTDRIIRLRQSDLSRSTIYHEGAHDLTFLKGGGTSNEVAWYNYEFIKSGTINGNPVTDTLASQWKSIAGDVYGKDLGKKNVGGNSGDPSPLASVWNDGFRGPRNGCVSAYGCNNFWEDIASYAEKSNDPSFFKPLISQNPLDTNTLELKTPGGTPIYYRFFSDNGNKVIRSWSPDQLVWMQLNNLVVEEGSYKGKSPTPINQEIIEKLNSANGNVNVLFDAAKTYGTSVKNAQYDPVYRQKIEWLYQNKFITERDYKKIVGDGK